MTANELIDLLEANCEGATCKAYCSVEFLCGANWAKYRTKNAVRMLRQQQAEIEELKKKTQYWLHTLHCTCGNHWEVSTYPPVLKEKEQEK